MTQRIVPTGLVFLLSVAAAVGAPSEERLARYLKKYPDADANGDGRLTVAEAKAHFRKNVRRLRSDLQRRGVPRTFPVDPGWDAEKFPDHAVCYKTPAEIKKIYPKITSWPKPESGALRIVGTGHSFMAPGYRSLPAICRAAGFRQPLLTHIGGGITGSARYKWEQENGIFQFDKRPLPKLLASIANAEWEAMMWGPYYNDRPVYYSCWIDFCLKFNPGMTFYLSDAWPQLEQIEKMPTSEKDLTAEVFVRLGRERNAEYADLMKTLNAKYPGKVFILPTSDAMVLAVDWYHRGRLPTVEGIHRAVGKKKRSLWRDRLGHLGPDVNWLEGYVFYATLYQRSPELIQGKVGSLDPGLDRAFRQIAWQAVTNHPYSGVTDTDGNGIGDTR